MSIMQQAPIHLQRINQNNNSNNNTHNISRHLTTEETAAFAKALDALRDEVMSSLGERDATYIRKVVKAVRFSEITGRGLLMTLGWLPPAWLAGVSLLGFSKIVENMELGHNVMHGQYDWMNDPALSGAGYDWDNTCAAPMWKHSHNYMHHTFTNIIGKDLDVGYDAVRMTHEQPWKAHDSINLIKIVGIATFFQWAVGYHDIQVTEHEYANHPDKAQMVKEKWHMFAKKITRQVGKDYLLFPALSGINLIPTLTGNAAANVIRNWWSFAIIFCGHFSADTEMFAQKDVVLAEETKGEWYIRQIKGSGNIAGGKWFHFMSGNLSHQIEHHLFPDMPANRYQDIALQIKALCDDYGIHYTTGAFTKQFSEVMVRIAAFSLPNDMLANHMRTMTVSELRRVAPRQLSRGIRSTLRQPSHLLGSMTGRIMGKLTNR